MNTPRPIWFIIAGILVLTFLLRLYKFHEPIADWHSWRQSDTAAVGKIYIQEGIDLLHPKYYDISNVQSGQDNPAGYRMVEFPLFSLIHVGMYSILPFLSIDEAGRISTIGFSVLASLFIFLISKRYFSARAGLISAFFYAVLPYSIYYGRSILPDTPMIASVLGGIYFFGKWIDSEEKNKISLIHPSFIYTVLFIAASLLFKPYALFFLLPIGVLALEKFGWRVVAKWQLWILAFLSVLPLALWRTWIMQYPEGIPYASWLFNKDNIRFKGAYFYWIFGERISQLILGYYTAFMTMGFFKRSFERHFAFFVSFIVSSIIYLLVIARGNVQHDYYQIAIIPSLTIFIGRGVDFLLSFESKTNRVVGIAVVVITSLLMFLLSWYHIREYFNINNRPMVEVGKKADEILPSDARVIAPFDGDTTFLYYINRRGWPSYQASTDELIQKGATHTVLLNPNTQTIKEFESSSNIIASGSGYIIVEH